MSKRPFALLAGLAILTAACSSVPTASTIDYGSGPRFLVTVADTLDNVGLGSSVDVDSSGLPFISYFGFPAPVKKGAIPIPRPVGTPFLPGVLLTTSNEQGMWTQGAIEQNKPVATPAGVTVPFGPVTTENFALAEDDSNGTAVVVAPDGTIHVAWTMKDGVYYGTTKAGGTASVKKVYDYRTSVSLAGPMSAPGIALDGDGNPWVAFSVLGANGLEVHAASLRGSQWNDQVVASEPPCQACPKPGPTGIGFVRGNPVVVFGDAVKHEVDAASPHGSTWVVDSIDTKTDGLGMSVATVGNTMYASYFTGHGTVDVATLDDHAPTTREVGKAENPDENDTGNSAARTAVTAQGGTIYAAWDDGDNGVQFVSGTDTDTFSSISLGPSAPSSAHPALAASDSAVYLSWYDTITEDLMLGIQGDVQNVIVAQPPPSLTTSPAAPSGPACSGTKVQLNVTAQGLAFNPTCLVAPADKPFTITMDNKDSGTQHDVSIYPSPDKLTPDDALLYSLPDPNPPGPSTVTYKSGGLSAGTYYFQCDYHPTQMSGTFAVVKGAS